VMSPRRDEPSLADGRTGRLIDVVFDRLTSAFLQFHLLIRRQTEHSTST
jgi:hypothetical protein